MYLLALFIKSAQIQVFREGGTSSEKMPPSVVTHLWDIFVT